MFLVAITKDNILHNFHSGEETRIHSWKFTSITDNILSKRIDDSNGFSIIESPLLSSDQFENMIFIRFRYNDREDKFNITRKTISGRPIYYTINSRYEFFCSTHISLLRKAGVSIEENISALPEFFVYRFVMPPNTLYKNIYYLLAGGQFDIKISNDKCKIGSINHYIPPEPNKNFDSLVKGSVKLYDYINSSIQKLESIKNELAVLLSGGIDSSILSNICKYNFNIKKSYSTSYPFENPLFNTEKRYALSAAEALDMDHLYYEPSTHEYLICLLESISLAEAPIHHLQTVLLHSLWKNKLKNEKIILCGQGGGSVFGNNPFFYIFQNRNELISQILLKRSILYIMKPLSKIFGRGEELITLLEKSSSTNSISDSKNPIWSWMVYGDKNWVCHYFNITEENIIKERYNVIKNFNDISMYDLWCLYSLFGDEDITLTLWSKIGEGNNKIIYFPFYDSTVLNYVFSIPWNIKLQKPFNGLKKEIARQVKIPDFIINRPKSSFGLHSKSWVKKNGIFEPLFPLTTKIFDENEIRKLQSYESKKSDTYWNILNYSIWKQICIYNIPLEVLLEELQ